MDATIRDQPATRPQGRSRGEGKRTDRNDSAVARKPSVALPTFAVRTDRGRVLVVPAPAAIVGLASLVAAVILAAFEPASIRSAALDRQADRLLAWETAERRRVESALATFEPELRQLRRTALQAGIVPPEVSACGEASARHLAGHVREAAWLSRELMARVEASDALDLVPSRSPIDLARAWVATSTPASGGIHVSSGWGRRTDPFTGDAREHQGLDLSAPAGTPVVAPSAGVVEFAGAISPNVDHARSLLGTHVLVRHGSSGYTTLYAHLETATVKAGQAVRAGDKLGTVGSTGRSTAPHLHYQVMRGEGKERVSLDPLYFITDAVLVREGRDVWYVPAPVAAGPGGPP